MVWRLITILFFGCLFTLIPVAGILGAVMNGYIRYYELRDCGRPVFFNPFFYDTIFHAGYGWIFLGVSFVVGIFMIFPPFFGNFFRLMYVMSILVVSLGFIPSVGLKVGEKMFYRPDTPIALTNGEIHRVDVLYKGREGIHFKDATKGYPSTFIWAIVQNGEQQRCYREVESQPKKSQPKQPQITKEEAEALGIQPPKEKKGFLEVLQQKLFGE
ncbi:hypothetical protein CCZ01_05590 [Helicobacter monodelphidis]|uniref:hypothetical protein n=1 Tax=Helicobacter sp. 15-1451 TaxID=2004995 RepID=UPI000DCB6EA1|nr:hypothetical protein [Helicobacter sp. 15-1451]RAX57613.1 hypothetical protein CCZ01_05590 [Helicobacter sp. 15-1451]